MFKIGAAMKGNWAVLSQDAGWLIFVQRCAGGSVAGEGHIVGGECTLV